MHNSNFVSGNKRLEKRNIEKTAFKNCKQDMSDISFEIGKSSYSVKIFGAIVVFALFFGIRIFIRSFVGNSEATLSAGDIVFWLFIILITILVIFTIFKEKKRPAISVVGRTLLYNGNCWSSDEISCVKCTKWFERVEIYSDGRRVLSFPWEMDNSELFIAWVNKCEILFQDFRMKSFQ